MAPGPLPAEAAVTAPVAPGERAPGRRPGGRALVAALLLLSLAKVGLMALYAVGAQFVMDEYVPLGYYGELLGRFYREVDPVKTVLHVHLYRVATWVADDAVGQMVAARLGTWLLAVATLALLYGVSRNLGRDRLEALFAVFVLLSFSTHLERAFRVRSDSWAAGFAMLALWAVARREAGRGWALAGGVFAGLAFCCTQKSIYVLAALLAGCAVEAVASRSRRALAFGGWLLAGWTLTLLAYALAFGGLDFGRVLAAVFTSPAEVALEADDLYPDLGRYVVQTLVRNPIPYALCFGGLLLALARLGRAPGEVRRAAGFTLVLTLLVFGHNQPWPYVFVLALPPLAAWSVEPLRRLAGAGRRYALVTAAAVVLLLTFSLPRNVAYLAHGNEEQNRAVAQAEALLGPDDTYCDGVRMVVTRRSACRGWWDAMGLRKLREENRRGDGAPIAAIFDRQPKLWIYNYRVHHLWPLLAPHVAPSYVQVTPNILLSGVRLESGREVTFVNRWPGAYALFDADGRPTSASWQVDGRRAGGVAELEARAHRVRLTSPGVAYLLPADSRLFEPIPRDGRALGLFRNVYEH